MANINDILNDARIKGCSDVHIGENTGITLRQDGKLIEFEQTFSNEEIKEMILSMCKDRILKIVEKHEDADFVYVNDLGRHRVNIYFQQGYMTAAIRIINEQIKTLEELNLHIREQTKMCCRISHLQPGRDRPRRLLEVQEVENQQL